MESIEDEYHSVTAKKITLVRCLFAPMDVGGGRIPGGVGIIEDITERKIAEEALKKSEQRYLGTEHNRRPHAALQFQAFLRSA